MPTLRCDGLCKSFGSVAALRDICFEFSSPRIIGIIGPNGAGKTTLFDVVTGFRRADRGRSFIDGQDVTHAVPYRIAQLGVARTFQELRVFSGLSIMDNVLLAGSHQAGESLVGAVFRFGVSAGDTRNREAAGKWLSIVGLAERSADLASNLSYGEQKLLSLASCLATGAQILLLDEPVAGLHANMLRRVLTLLRDLRSKGLLIVIIEHDVAAVREIADHIIIMDAGTIIAQGNPEEVLSLPKIMEAYVG